MDTVQEGESGTNGESTNNIYTLPCVKEIAGDKLLYNTGSPAWYSLRTQRGRMGGSEEDSRVR